MKNKTMKKVNKKYKPIKVNKDHSIKVSNEMKNFVHEKGGEIIGAFAFRSLDFEAIEILAEFGLAAIKVAAKKSKDKKLALAIKRGSRSLTGFKGFLKKTNEQIDKIVNKNTKKESK